MTDDSNGATRRTFLRETAALLTAGSLSGCVGADDGGIPHVDEPWEKFIKDGKTDYQGRVRDLDEGLKSDTEEFKDVNRALEKGNTLEFNLDEEDDTVEENKVEIDGKVAGKYPTDGEAYSGKGIEVAPGVAIAEHETGKQDIVRESSIQNDGNGATNAEFDLLERSEEFGPAVDDIAGNISSRLSDKQLKELKKRTNDMASLGIYFETVNAGEDAEQPIFPEEGGKTLEHDLRELKEMEDVYRHIANEAEASAVKASNIKDSELGTENYQDSFFTVPFVNWHVGADYDPETDLTDVEAHQMEERLGDIHEDYLDLRDAAVEKLAEIQTARKLVNHALNEYDKRSDEYERPDDLAGEPEEPPMPGNGGGGSGDLTPDDLAGCNLNRRQEHAVLTYTEQQDAELEDLEVETTTDDNGDLLFQYGVDIDAGNYQEFAIDNC